MSIKSPIRLALLLPLVAACGSPTQSSGANEIVNPTGEDAFIVVTAPETTDGFAGFISIDNQFLQKDDLGKPIKVQKGEHCVDYNRYGNRFGGDCFTVASGEVKTYALAGFRIQTTGPAPFGLFSRSSDVSPPYLAGALNTELSPLQVGHSNWALPGEYRVKLGFEDGFHVTLTAGAVQDIDFSSLAERRAVVIKRPTGVAFTDAYCMSRRMVVRIEGKRDVNDVRSSAWDDFGDFLGSAGASSVAYSGYALAMVFPILNSNGSVGGENSSERIPLQLSAKPGDAPAVLQLGRIDVNDVAVTQPDGSVAMVAGKWKLTRAGADGIYAPFFKECTFDTKSGVTVPPGAYKIETTYELNGQPATDVKAVTMR